MNPLFKGFLAACRPADRRPPWQWAEEHVEVDPMSQISRGKWRSENSPWVREVLDQFSNPSVREINIECSAQSSKTQTMGVGLFWSISEDPGPVMWVTSNDDDAREFVRDRLAVPMRRCRPVVEKLVSEGVDNWVFSTCPVYFRGAGSPAKLQSKPIRWLYLDEVRNYPPGALETVLKRTRAAWNSKTVLISTPGKEKDAVNRAFLAGDQRIYHIPCPHCGHFQPLKFEQLKWDTNETTKPGGRWRFDDLASTIRFECRSCKGAIRDDPSTRKRIAREGKFVAMNPNAPARTVSFKWNALLPFWVPWRSIVEEFIAARAAIRNGNKEPMQAFVNETLGEPWKDELGEIDDFDFLRDRCGTWKIGDPWPDELTRFMAADRQEAGGEHYWYVIRAVGPAGKTRLISYGRAETKWELEELRKSHSVPIENSIIDSGNGQSTAEVYRWCRATGWKAAKGDSSEGYIHRDPVSGRSFRRLWQISRVDPAIGKSGARQVTIRLYRWSNPGIKDLLFDSMTGTIPGWELPKDIGDDYLAQISAEHREEVIDHLGHSKFVWKQTKRDNHLLDCELMICVALVASRLTPSAPTKANPPS